ncbi:EAL domain-containing response regulator [Massilia sp. PWRC2]|uniref:EAL domain-containing response regulator n=1 Tax=Massilia sp. PWRC2 TaxID=2804626 RepID=UPI003CF3F595
MDITHLQFLVAEAEPGQRRLLADMLVQMGAHAVIEVAEGHAALRYCQGSDGPAVQVALIDLALPGIDGLELIRRLAAMACPVRLIVVGRVAANLLFAVETMAQAYGVDLLGTLSAPVSSERLQELLGNYTQAPAVCALAADGVASFGFAEVADGVHQGQFEPFFQPKIELATGHVTGLETFARWRHPQHGLLGPQAFMAALEQRQRMDVLDWSMIEQSIERCRAFHDMGMPISMSINVAPDTLAQADFLTQAGACLERYRLLPDYITFEISEASVLSIEAAFVERLLRMRMAGFGLAIDDYGTGRSNLQLLARIPFSELKIDRSFVDGASKKRALGTVLSSCLGLARSLDRKSVAVGVETRQDWEFLQSLGCTCAQGYYIASPMEASAFPEWLSDWREYF